MSAAGPAAVLTGALMARKGTAAPADFAPLPLVSGTGTPRPTGSARPAAAGGPPPGMPPAAHRAKLTLRLDPDRHRRLKLCAAHAERSLQDLVVAALDAYLDQLGAAVMNGRCACLAGDAGEAD